MIKSYISIVIVLIGFQIATFAQNSNEMFTIYLVRHSEKMSESNNPPLTPCGEQRSENLSVFLSDVQLDEVYSTNYKRTKNTALPTATSKGLEIIEYDSEALENFSKLLLENKKDALVVGHSNTTGVLAGLLVGEEIGEFDLSIYDRVYQVVICNDIAQLNLLHVNIDCNE